MRKGIAILLLIAGLTSCQKEAFIEEGGLDNGGDVVIGVDPTDDEIFNGIAAQDPRPSLDNSNQGLYRGVFSTYNTSYHGEIIINVGNDGNFTAAIHLVDGTKLLFNAQNRSLSDLQFFGNNGSFIYDVSDIENPIARNVTLNQEAAYIYSFKEKSTRRISIVLGHYEDKTDSSFYGNWDLVSFGIPEFNFPGALRFETLILSNGTNTYMDSNSADRESFSGCYGFDVNGPYLAQLSQDLLIVEGKNQEAIFNGSLCQWSLSFSIQDNRATYSNENCEPIVGFGKWAWTERSGSLFVDAIRIN